jgi:hypothetical protein
MTGAAGGRRRMSARVRSRQGRARAWRIPRRCETRFAASRRGTRRRLFPRTARRGGAGLRADRRDRGTDGSGDRRGPTVCPGQGSTGPGRGTTPRQAWPRWASARGSSRRQIGTPRRTGSAMSVSITLTLSASRMASRLRRSPVVRVSSGTLARRRSKKPGTFSGSGCAIIRSTHLRNRTARMRCGRVLQYPVRIIHVPRGRGLIILLPSVASI